MLIVEAFDLHLIFNQPPLITQFFFRRNMIQQLKYVDIVVNRFDIFQPPRFNILNRVNTSQNISFHYSTDIWNPSIDTNTSMYLTCSFSEHCVLFHEASLSATSSIFSLEFPCLHLLPWGFGEKEGVAAPRQTKCLLPAGNEHNRSTMNHLWELCSSESLLLRHTVLLLWLHLMWWFSSNSSR